MASKDAKKSDGGALARTLMKSDEKGKPQRGSVPKRRKKAARKKSTAKRKAPGRAKAKKPKKHDPKSIKTLAELADAFVQHLVLVGKSPGTVRSYRADLVVAQKHFTAETPVKNLTERKVLGYFKSDRVNLGRDGKKKNEITIAKIKRVFRQMILFATESGLFSKAPLPAAEK